VTRQFGLVSVLIATTALNLPQTLAAQVLPPVQYQAQLSNDQLVFNFTTPYNESGPGWTVTQSIYPDPTVSTTAEGLQQEVSFSGIYYYMWLVGPIDNSVPVTFAGYYSIGGSGLFNSEAETRLYSEGGEIDVGDSINSCGFDGKSVFGECGTLPYSITINVTPIVSFADANNANSTAILIGAQSSTTIGGSSEAWTDPGIFADPSFPGADQYSIVLSPGFGNPGAPVPEPSTWAMMLIGFSGLGFAGFRQSRKSGAGSLRFSSPIG
jgi:hypothetical protein